ncbi:tryptophan--tRNA ligase MSW1 SCDLUD_003181 [Saccharomycodes ludwigii]|uniref:tryptophan--tRNA ligase MSW1 n=1 Tax=Saccharomycodes ludwigii TaxID=36035 RepID=UPI001E8ADDD3|nr:hypothetical protein SCDLUD_003181 [Saccharomycodes ludwigii]KAH3900210.1 hypothetical protein SCDLUD_003181 [Saccharomycodes ludwigii]
MFTCRQLNSIVPELRSPLFSKAQRFLTSHTIANSKGTIKTTDYKLHTDDIPSNATIFSMIQPTGQFHLGNYLGAVRVWKDLCDLKSSNNKNDVKLLFGAADLHAITIPKPDAKSFKKTRLEAIASLLSIGIDPKKAIIFTQSGIKQHAELHWILSTFASMGTLNRMTQWKSKAATNDLNNVKLGLFSYPVLQAADILIYKATHVPVGDDQAQHLECTRTLAGLFNNCYKTNLFPLPKTMLAPTKKILSLSNVEKKMSKSDPNQNSLIYLNDPPESIQRKIKKAVTDSITDHFNYDPIERPGLSNLTNMISGVQRKSIQDVEKDFSRFNNYRDLKSYIADILIEHLREPRENFNKLVGNPDFLESVIKNGVEAASEIAEKNIQEIKKTMGFL